MKVIIATPCCHCCKHYKEPKEINGKTCYHPNAPYGNDSPSGYMINCHGIGFEWTDWNSLSIEIDVPDDVAKLINSQTRYREVKS